MRYASPVRICSSPGLGLITARSRSAAKPNYRALFCNLPALTHILIRQARAGRPGTTAWCAFCLNWQRSARNNYNISYILFSITQTRQSAQRPHIKTPGEQSAIIESQPLDARLIPPPCHKSASHANTHTHMHTLQPE